MFCSKCGAAIAADAAFCASCGTAIMRAAYPAAPLGGVSPHAGVGGIAYASNVAYAGFWLRFVAYLIDTFIVGAVSMALLIPLFFMMGGAALLARLPRDGGEPFEPAVFAGFFSTIAVLIAVGVVVKWLYFAYLESGEKQGTWGKQAIGVYVTDLSGNRVTFGQASGRFFAKIISGLIPLWIGYIMAGFTQRKQALHDMIASCLVLRR